MKVTVMRWYQCSLPKQCMTILELSKETTRRQIEELQQVIMSLEDGLKYSPKT